MTADMLALRDAILRDPADDQLRRAYADACRDAGEVERGEFVEVQLELAKMPPMGPRENDPRYMIPEPWESLRRRERELLVLHGKLWVEPGRFMWLNGDGSVTFHLDCPGGVYSNSGRFRRGFVAEVRLTWEAWRDHGDVILAEHPVEVVRLTTWPSDIHYDLSVSIPGVDAARRRYVLTALLTRWPADPDRPRIRFELSAEPILHIERNTGDHGPFEMEFRR